MMVGTDKQVAWAETIKNKIINDLSVIADKTQLEEIEKVDKASWWIDRRNYLLNKESLDDLVGCAWIVNNGIALLNKASEAQVNSALRNDGILTPLRYSFGSMCGQLYSHLLTLKNGTTYVVSQNIANSFQKSDRQGE